MVTIVDYKTYQREDGTEFHILMVQGGVEAIKSKQTDKVYLTARMARVACTFNKNMCKAAIGTTLEGRIERVETEPYQYNNPETGEIMTLGHRYEFISEEESIVKDNVIKSEVVI